MPANIDRTTGTAAVMTVGPAWHRLGKQLDAPATAAEAIKHAGLDWKVSKLPLASANIVLWLSVGLLSGRTYGVATIGVLA